MKFDILDFFEVYSSPSMWPLWARRVFLLTFPVSVPVWYVSCALGVVIAAIVTWTVYVGFFGALWAMDLWKKKDSDEDSLS